MERDFYEDTDAKKGYIRLKKTMDDGYKERMLTECQSKLFLRAVIRNMDGESEYYYDNSNGQTLSEYAAGRELSGTDIYNLLLRIASMLQEAEKHLLSCEDVMLSPEYIFLDGGGRNARFCYYPEKCNNIERADFIDLAEYLLEVTDHGDEIATELSYGYYNQVCGGDYDPAELISKYYEETETGEEEEQVSESEVSENLETETEKESFYFRDREEEEEKLEVGKGVKTLIICFAVIVGLGGLYILCFLNKSILEVIGLAQKDYIVSGAVVSGVMAVTLIVLIKNHMKKLEIVQSL